MLKKIIPVPAALAFAFALALNPGMAGAQTFPGKPIRLVAPYPPGGPSDVTLRQIAERLQLELGQPVIVDNRPGAGTAIASDYVAHAPADGYTLLYAGSSFTMLPAISKVNYDPVKDFTPISMAINLAVYLVVRSDVPARNVGELVSYLKANPGKLNYSSVGTGSVTHFQMEQFLALTDTKATHIPYKGEAPALTDMIGGRLQMGFISYTSAGPYMQTGMLRPLAVTLNRRLPLTADVPTLAEAGVGAHNATAWSGFLAPANTPKAVIDRLNSAVVQSLRDPDLQARLRAAGAEANPSTPEEFAVRLRSETGRWANLAQQLNIRAE